MLLCLALELIDLLRARSEQGQRGNARKRAQTGAHIDESLELALADADLLGELCAGRRVSEARP